MVKTKVSPTFLIFEAQDTYLLCDPILMERLSFRAKSATQKKETQGFKP
jgi:hypothetical protein